jgi:hypothetical protein
MQITISDEDEVAVLLAVLSAELSLWEPDELSGRLDRDDRKLVKALRRVLRYYDQG